MLEGWLSQTKLGELHKQLEYASFMEFNLEAKLSK